MGSQDLAGEPPSHENPSPEPAQAQVGQAAPASHAGRARASWRWLRQEFLTRPWRTWAVTVTGMALGLAGELLDVAGFKGAGFVVLAFAAVIFFLGGALAYPVSLIMRLFPAAGAAAKATIFVTFYIYVGFFQLFVAFVATAGAMSAVHAAYTNQVASGLGGQATGLAGLMCLLAIPALLIGIPEVLRRNGQTWDQAVDPAKARTPAFLAAWAAVATYLYIIAEHFFGGPLAGPPLRVLLAGGIAVAAMLAPAYQIVARACWEHGVAEVLDPARWRKAWRAVSAELGDAFEQLEKKMDAKPYGSGEASDTAPPDPAGSGSGA
jgi:hypothetical protein